MALGGLVLLSVLGCTEKPPPGEEAAAGVAPHGAPVARPEGAPDAAARGSRTPPLAAGTTPREGTAFRRELIEPFQLIRSGNTGAARVRLKKYRTLHPNDGQAAFLFGLTYHGEKRYAKSRPYFEEAIELEPDYATTYYFSGWGLYYLGELDAARAAFMTHLEFIPDSADTHFGLGVLDLEEDRLDDAEMRLTTAIEFDAGTEASRREVAKAHARRADVHVRRSDYEKAKADLVIATTLYPDHYEAFHKLSRVYFRLGEEKAAEEAQQQFIASRQRIRPGTSFPE